MQLSNACAPLEPTCEACPALCASRTQIVLPTPCQDGILAIGEAPGADEDRLGFGFAGRAGKTLDTLFLEHGFVRGRHYGVANICRCRPADNRKPSATEISQCLPKLAQFILDTRPKVLLLVGGTPTAAFLGSGSLSLRIQGSKKTLFTDLALGHPGLAALRAYGGVLAVPMPHTSPLAFNRVAPDGRKWSEIAREQVRMAVEAFQHMA